MTGQAPLRLDEVLVVDIEVHGRRIAEIGACRGEQAFRETDLERARERLAEMARASRAVAGHNAAEHDLPRLAELWPDHPLLRLPLIDTLLWSPIIRPERPYHALVKDRELVRREGNDPLSDARTCQALLADVLAWQEEAPPAALRLARAAEAAFTRGRPWAAGPLAAPAAVLADLRARAEGCACTSHLSVIEGMLEADPELALPLACLAGWLRLPTGSILPPWLLRRVPATKELLTLLRETDCGRPDCPSCAGLRGPEPLLRQWFPRLPGFREWPRLREGSSAPGEPAQRAIVRAGMRGESFFAILPTGAGKSICFQLPAIHRASRTGALTVVISPLQSLMKDQVDGLRERTDYTGAFALHGGLDLLNRGRVLSAITQGEAGLVYLSPEQLRNPGTRAALRCREIAAWVFDEAHCMAEWGHDFRTDYWYAPRFIAELAGERGQPIPAIAAFTATAQPEVVRQVRERIEETCRRSLRLFDARAERENLELVVLPAPARAREAMLQERLQEDLPAQGAAIVFCERRRRAESVANGLTAAGWPTLAYHAGMDGVQRREVQEAFLGGDVRVIAATSAFGMGVDKADVRLVLHDGIPPSLEDYVQQVGRAGRDGGPARAVLLWQEEDGDRLLRQVQQGALKARDIERVRQVVAKEIRKGRAELTVGEIGRLAFGDDERDWERVPECLAWLERAGLLLRDENRPRVFQGRPRIREAEEARRRLRAEGLDEAEVELALGLLAELWSAEGGESLDSDELASRLALSQVRGAGVRLLELLERMVRAEVLQPGILLKARIFRDAVRRRERAAEAEARLFDGLSEQAVEGDAWWPLHLGALGRELPGLEPAAARAALRQASADRDETGRPLLSLRARGPERFDLRLPDGFPPLVQVGRRRRQASAVVLDWLLSQKADATGRLDFTLESVCAALRADLALRPGPGEAVALAERALLSLHDLNVLVLESGLSVFRTAMRLRTTAERSRRYGKEEHEPCEQHRRSRLRQAHAMVRYAERAARSPRDGRELLRVWFDGDPVHRAHLFPQAPGPTRPGTRRRVLDALDTEQRRVVEAPAGAELLVLAGPGSGKTRTLVHRAAWLVLRDGVPPRRLLVLCYNRATVGELRRRLVELLGESGREVRVSTLHALALSLAGPAGEDRAQPDFDEMLRRAVRLLRGEPEVEGQAPAEPPEFLRAGWTHLLVDEVQDIDPLQAELLAALVGGLRARDEQDEEGHRLAVFAVGDDDQNIYAWRGARGEFLRQLKQSAGVQVHELVRNYRSPPALVALANQLAARIPVRLKERPIVAATPLPYGEPPTLARVDGDAQAVAEVRAQVERWRREGVAPETIAVLARHHELLAAVHEELSARGVPCRTPPLREPPDLWRLRETRRLVESVPRGETLRMAALRERFEALRRTDPDSRWWGMLEERLADFEAEVGAAPFTGVSFEQDLWAGLRDERGLSGLGRGVHLCTQHSAKGLEWDAVIVLGDLRPDELAGGAAGETRLSYVALTRARRRLHLVQWRDRPVPWAGLVEGYDSPVAPVARLAPRRRRLNLDGIFLDFAGQKAATEPVHAALDGLRMGARLAVRREGSWVRLVDGRGVAVACLSEKGRRDLPADVAELSLFALVERHREQSAAEWAARLRVDRWWVPMVEWEEG